MLAMKAMNAAGMERTMPNLSSGFDAPVPWAQAMCATFTSFALTTAF
jgi:hypothetical protein